MPGAAAMDFDARLEASGCPQLRPLHLDIFQINLGKRCNMACRHCHVSAGPNRAEVMERSVIDACLRALDTTGAHTVDLTGGAPELNPSFRYLVDECVRRGKHVIDRCNLTVLLTQGQHDTPAWLAEHGVEVVGSLTHYRKRNTDRQRGPGVFEQSIEALRRLNEAGYGKGDPRRVLTLMTNPAGAFLAGSQASLEGEWRVALKRDHGITFDRLIALNNMPIARFRDWLITSDNLEPYMQRLHDAFNPATVDGLMCRNTLSVGWDGRVFDCDFNQMLEMDAEDRQGRAFHIAEFDLHAWESRSIRTDSHCYGCTAGAGSSCGGATAAD
jgi:radical SAM/Cys-rich protein